MWKKASGSGGGTGLKGIFAPLIGKTISCSTAYGSTVWAMVDASGNIYSQAKVWCKPASGWVYGTTASSGGGCSTFGQTVTATVDTTGLTGTHFEYYDGGSWVSTCRVLWPPT